MQYVQSDRITVFPAAFRGSGYYKSRLTSEENLTLLSKYARSKHSVLKDGDYTIIIIEGYIFKLPTKSVPDGNNLYATIYLKADENIGRLLGRVEETPSGDTALDSDGIFFGLGFDTADKVKKYSAAVLVRNAAGDIFYSDVTEQAFAKNQAIVSNEEGKLIAKNLSSTQEATTSGGIIEKIVVSQDAQGKISAVSLSTKSPSPKDLATSGYETGRILGTDPKGNLTWMLPSAAAGVNDSEFKINGTKIWSANSTSDGNLNFSSDFTFSNGTVRLAKAIPDPQNGILQINHFNLFTANQASNSNLNFNKEHFNYDEENKEISLKNAINNGALQIAARNEEYVDTITDIFSANAHTNTKITLIPEHFTFSRITEGVNEFKLKLQDDLSLVSLILKAPKDRISSLRIASATPASNPGEILAATTLDGIYSYITVGKDTTIERDAGGKPTSNNAENRREFKVAVQQNADNCAVSLTKTLKSVGISAQIDYHRVGVFLDTQSFTLTALRKNPEVDSITGYVVEDIIKMDATNGTINCTTLKQSCDRRLKENIIPYSCGQSILNLPVYSYNFIGQENKQIGCMAQDLQKICPEIVSTDTNGYLTIQESKIVYLLLEEIKKLRLEVDTLEKEMR